MSFFSNLNRKERRKFKGLNKEQQIEILTAEINKKTSEARNKAVATTFLDGYLFANKMLYEKYVVYIEGENKQSVINALMNEIKQNNEQYHQKHTKEDADDGSNDGNESEEK